MAGHGRHYGEALGKKAGGEAERKSVIGSVGEKVRGSIDVPVASKGMMGVALGSCLVSTCV